MACPTCGNARMRQSGEWTYWCARCGTWKTEMPGGEPAVTAPELVERCREFEGVLAKIDTGEAGAADFWRGLGIAESIHPPERPEHTEEELKGGTE